jgi:hypothetical protein
MKKQSFISEKLVRYLLYTFKKISLLLNNQIKTAICIGLIHLAIGLFVNRFHIGFSAMEFGMLSEASNLKAGGSILSLWPGEPYGYSILLWLLSTIVGTTINSAIIIALFSSFFSGAIFYLIASELFDKKWAIISSIVFLFQYQQIAHTLYLWVEAPFATLILCYLYVIILAKKADYPPHLCLFGAILSSILFNLRYIGAIFVLLYALDMIAAYYSRRINFKYLTGYGLVCLFICMPLLYRNYILTGHLSGHPVGLTPAYTFFGAFYELLIQLGIFGLTWFPASFWSAGQLFTVPLVVFIFMIMAFAISVSHAIRDTRFPAYILPFYIVSFSVAEASTRLDLIHYRFVHPVIPLLIFSFYYLLQNVRTVPFPPLHIRSIVLIMLGILPLITMIGVSSVETWKGNIPADFNYSPETLRKLKELSLDDSPILVNRYGDQLTIDFPNKHLITIPYSDIKNGNFTEAWGMRPWTRDKLIEYVAENKIKYLVFFLGKNHIDPFLEGGEYGESIKPIFLGEDPIVASRIEVTDGVIITFK